VFAEVGERVLSGRLLGLNSSGRDVFAGRGGPEEEQHGEKKRVIHDV
jgi:hypothetical protein